MEIWQRVNIKSGRAEYFEEILNSTGNGDPNNKYEPGYTEG